MRSGSTGSTSRVLTTSALRGEFNDTIDTSVFTPKEVSDEEKLQIIIIGVVVGSLSLGLAVAALSVYVHRRCHSWKYI